MNKIKSFFALMIMVFIPFGAMIWYRNHHPTEFAGIELILYPLLFGGLGIAMLYILKRYFLKEDLREFNSGSGEWMSDIVWGMGLAMVYFCLFYIERLTLSNLLSFHSNSELLGLMLDMRQNPLIMALFFGPVLWIGIALYEEVIRIFILTELWKWKKARLWDFVVILLSAVLIGLVHWSQGLYGIVTIAIKGLISGIYFYKKRRIMPLVYAHVLYDGIQVAILLITYPDN